MKISKTAATVLITVIVIAALAAAGFGIYRLGYAHGLTASAGDFIGERFFHDFGSRFPRGMGRGMTPYFGVRQPLFGFPLWGVFSGLLLFAGLVALIVIAITSLVRKNRKADAIEPEASPPAEQSS